MLVIVGEDSTVSVVNKSGQAITLLIINLVLNDLVSVALEILKSSQHRVDLILEDI